MLGFGADDGAWAHGLIEGYQTAVVPDREREKVAVCDLLWPEQRARVKDRCVRETDVVGTEAVIAAIHRLGEAQQNLGHWQRIWIAGARHDPRGAVFGDWAGCPSRIEIVPEPVRRRAVADVLFVQQRDQYVHVEERAEWCAFVLSRHRFRVGGRSGR